MKLKRFMLLGLAMMSLGLSLYGCNGAPPETEADKKAVESSKNAQPPANAAAKQDKAAASPGQLPPPP